MSAALALIAHDLKNALGGLESELGLMADAPTPEQARNALLHCGDLRREFIQFLTLYGAETDGLRALCEDESPLELLESLQRAWQVRLERSGARISVELTDSLSAPSHWYFDRRLVQLALDAAIHNATRFARCKVTLSAQTLPSEEGPWLSWQIRDDGPGLGSDPGCLHATGLGTALCEQVAWAHTLSGRQGQVRLTDHSDGGAVFEMRLP
jgi:signal transduction histidine kinase